MAAAQGEDCCPEPGTIGLAEAHCQANDSNPGKKPGSVSKESCGLLNALDNQREECIHRGETGFVEPGGSITRELAFGWAAAEELRDGGTQSRLVSRELPASAPPHPGEGPARTRGRQRELSGGSGARRGRGGGPRGRGPAAGARRGLQVPACPAALTRPPPPLKRLREPKPSGRRGFRFAAAAGREGAADSAAGSPGVPVRAAPRGASGPALPVRGFPAEAPAPPGSQPRPPRPRCLGMDRAALRAAAMGEKKEGGGGGDAAAAEGGAGAAASRALQQCGQLQKLIDISIGSLRGLRTKCAVSNDLTQQEIRTLEAKLVRYICKQRQCKLSVAPSERTPELNSYPRFSDWLYTFNVRPEVVQVCRSGLHRGRHEGPRRGHTHTPQG
ncbi:collagen alpha-1(III) chain-like [Sapajus apella]|uniref:Collagen alpha-1(III) chain-like n=1 Tax=Sapajus apella TaxID=9515 RepID=A0A6J3H3I8_SAPAP|nr:collagen alpha-1(III) chain-like [Sapajus apella]